MTKVSESAAPRPSASAAPVQHVRQHLVMQRWQPEVSDELDMFDRNLAGKRLLPHLDPFDWTDAEEIARAQVGIPDPLKEVLRQVDSTVPEVKLWVDGDGKIVLVPQEAEALIARICAAAHQGRYGHLSHDVSCFGSNSVFAAVNAFVHTHKV